MRRSLLILLAIALVVVALPLALWMWTGAERQPPGAASSGVQTVLSPVIRLTSWSADRLAGGLEYLVASGQVREENELFSEEVARLRVENQVLRRALARYERLNPAAVFAELRNWETIPADVIALAGQSWNQTVVIDRGSRSNVEPGDPVFHVQGLCGMVLSVTPWTATVQLLTDPRTALGVRVLPSEAPGVINGGGERGALEITLEMPHRPLLPGQTVVTSGMRDSLYPAGLPIGEVRALGRNRFGQTVGRVRPFVDFRHLNEVLVLKTPLDRPEAAPHRPPIVEAPRGEDAQSTPTLRRGDPVP